MLEKLKDLLDFGIISDLYKAQRSLYIHRMIGTHAAEINKAENYKKELFVLLQNLTFSDATLALARVYDNPDNKYPNRCIRAVIDLLKELAVTDHSIIEKYQLIDQIRIHQFPDLLIKHVEEGNTGEFTKCFAWHLEGRYWYPDFQSKISELKSIRDKILAHNESTTEEYKAKYQTFEDLIYFTQSIVAVIGIAYFSTVYSINEKYVLQDDAQRISFNLKQILQDLGIIETQD